MRLRSGMRRGTHGLGGTEALSTTQEEGGSMRSLVAAAICALSFLVSAAAFAAPPVVTTVPADPNNPLSLHDIISGRPTTLKGAADASCANVCTWIWDPGDGQATVSGT